MTEADALSREPLGQGLSVFLARNAPPALAQVVFALANAAIPIAARISRGPLGGGVDALVEGDISKSLSAFVDKAFEQALRRAPALAYICEARDAFTPLNSEGRFLIALDPLEGPSHTDIDMTMGSIFSLFDAPATATLGAADFLQPGNRQRAAGLIVYGPHTLLLFTLGAGAHIATLDPRAGAFVMTQAHVDIPEGKAEVAINAANARHWPDPIRAYVEDCLMGESGPRGKDFNMRWLAALAADAYRVMRRGGAYLDPDDARPGYAQGRLRLVFQANPIAFLIEQAGGMAIDGVNRILDIPPKGLNMRTPLIFGSTEKVERIRSYFVDGHRSAARAPLFAKRGLLR